MTDTTTAAPTDHERGMAALRAIDPQARALWSVSGPRDTPGKIAAVLLNHETGRRVVILHSYPGGFDVFAETDKKASLSDALDTALADVGDGE